MKTIKNDFLRKLHFEHIMDYYFSDNATGDYKKHLNSLSKIDLIRFVEFLYFFYGDNTYIGVNGAGTLSIFER